MLFVCVRVGSAPPRLPMAGLMSAAHWSNRDRSNTGQILVKCWSNTGQAGPSPYTRGADTKGLRARARCAQTRARTHTQTHARTRTHAHARARARARARTRTLCLEARARACVEACIIVDPRRGARRRHPRVSRCKTGAPDRRASVRPSGVGLSFAAARPIGASSIATETGLILD